MSKKINIIVSCGFLNIKDNIEVDRFSRFKLQLQNIKQLGEIPENIKWTFAEFGDKENNMHDLIRQYIPNCNYTFVMKKENERFNQVKLWETSINEFPSDFYIFVHSDILFSKNFYEALNKRIVDEDKNYYAFRYNCYEIYDILNILNNSIEIRNLQCDDYGFKYILDKNKKRYDNVFPSMVFKNPGFNINQNAGQIPQSFICVSDKNIKKFDLNKMKDFSYNNDTIIRDLSVVYNINHEWVNNDLILIHLQGLDDMLKSNEKEYETTLSIIKNYNELSHFGMFRFHKDNIPYLNKQESKFIYENYLYQRGTVWNEQELKDFIYK
jgi:hypothetical protein